MLCQSTLISLHKMKHLIVWFLLLCLIFNQISWKNSSTEIDVMLEQWILDRCIASFFVLHVFLGQTCKLQNNFWEKTFFFHLTHIFAVLSFLIPSISKCPRVSFWKKITATPLLVKFLKAQMCVFFRVCKRKVWWPVTLQSFDLQTSNFQHLDI